MQPHEYRSFLSLDLAESQSMRSATVKKKQSQPLRKRPSRDSLRTIPSPKPAPSIDLPDLPPRLPSIPTLPALELPTFRISRTRPPTKLVNPRLSIVTKASTSTVATAVRRANRSEALARLEGRSKEHVPPLPLHKPLESRRNFMSMSDDEDDDDDDDDEGPEPAEDSDLESLDLGNVLNPILEPEDVVLPLPSPTTIDAPRSAPLPHRFKARLSPSSSGSSARRRRHQKRTSDDWFPLKSFIDLHADEDPANRSSWSWRSFIEVAHVA